MEQRHRTVLPLSGLPLRVSPDLRIEADPGAQLTPAQGFVVAEQIVHAAARLTATTPRPPRRPAASTSRKAVR